MESHVTDAEFLKNVALFTQPLMMGIIIWFIKDKAKETKDQNKELRDAQKAQTTQLALIEKDIQLILSTQNEQKLEIKNLKADHDEVVVMKRDMQTMWKRLDDLKAKNP